MTRLNSLSSAITGTSADRCRGRSPLWSTQSQVDLRLGCRLRMADMERDAGLLGLDLVGFRFGGNLIDGSFSLRGKANIIGRNGGWW